MGVRKRETADARKEANKSLAFAKLNRDESGWQGGFVPNK